MSKQPMPSTTTTFFRPHPRVRFHPVGESMTMQSFAEESEINNIMAKYEQTGVLAHVNRFEGQYAEMPSQCDFSDAMNLVTDAQSMFNELPAETRFQFGNDPGRFLDFVSDPENIDAMRQMGLTEPLAVPEGPPSAAAPAPAGSEDPAPEPPDDA